jgi:hypothetical protein
MLNQRLKAARSVAEELHRFENALDETISCGAQFSSRLVIARMEANLSAVVGQEALNKVFASLSAIVAARGQLVTAHHELKTVADDIGLQTVGFGQMKPRVVTPVPLTNHLTVAA